MGKVRSQVFIELPREKKYRTSKKWMWLRCHIKNDDSYKRLKRVVSGTHWLKGRIYYHNPLQVNFKNNRHHPNKRY